MGGHFMPWYHPLAWTPSACSLYWIPRTVCDEGLFQCCRGWIVCWWLPQWCNLIWMRHVWRGEKYLQACYWDEQWLCFHDVHHWPHGTWSAQWLCTDCWWALNKIYLVIKIQAGKFHVKNQVLGFTYYAGDVEVSLGNAHLEFYYIGIIFLNINQKLSTQFTLYLHYVYIIL